MKRFLELAALLVPDLALLAGLSMAWYGLEMIHSGAGFAAAGSALVGIALLKGRS